MIFRLLFIFSCCLFIFLPHESFGDPSRWVFSQTLGEVEDKGFAYNEDPDGKIRGLYFSIVVRDSASNKILKLKSLDDVTSNHWVIGSALSATLSDGTKKTKSINPQSGTCSLLDDELENIERIQPDEIRSQIDATLRVLNLFVAQHIQKQSVEIAPPNEKGETQDAVKDPTAAVADLPSLLSNLSDQLKAKVEEKKERGKSQLSRKDKKREELQRKLQLMREKEADNRIIPSFSDAHLKLVKRQTKEPTQWLIAGENQTVAERGLFFHLKKDSLVQKIDLRIEGRRSNEEFRVGSFEDLNEKMDTITGVYFLATLSDGKQLKRPLNARGECTLFTEIDQLEKIDPESYKAMNAHTQLLAYKYSRWGIKKK